MDWRRKYPDQVDDLIHSCHDHYDGNPGSPIGGMRRRRDVSEQEEEEEEEEWIVEIDLPLPEEAATVGRGKKGGTSSSQGPAIMVTPAAVVVVDDEQDEKDRFPMLTNICRHVSKDPAVSVIVLVGVVLLGTVELLAVIVCGVGWVRGCRMCAKKCGAGSRQQLCDA